MILLKQITCFAFLSQKSNSPSTAFVCMTWNEILLIIFYVVIEKINLQQKQRLCLMQRNDHWCMMGNLRLHGIMFTLSNLWTCFADQFLPLKQSILYLTRVNRKNTDLFSVLTWPKTLYIWKPKTSSNLSFVLPNNRSRLFDSQAD